MEGAIILHETLHEMHKRKKDGVILKLDFEKAYDKVDWKFLQQTLRMKGFEPRWCKWIDQVVRGGSVAVKVNDEIGNFFQTKKGLRQGDPLSPLLFNLVADMLAVLIQRTSEHGKIHGVIPHLVDDGLSILQYADDTILFMEHDLEDAKNLKLVLSAFERLSGLKINFHKSELLCFGKAIEVEREYALLFGCKTGSYTLKYLGLPMHYRKLSNKDWKEVEERFQKRLGSWKGKLLSVGGRLVLINSVLSSLAMYMLSFFEVPKGIIKKLDYYRSRFFWQSDEHKKKYRLARWSVLCKPKECGGLGIQNLEVQNKCLLRGLAKLVWQNLLRKKYLAKKTIMQVQKQRGDSHFWTGLMGVKDTFSSFGSFKLQDGLQIRFWEDCWLGNQSLEKIYPSLYNLVRNKNVVVAKVLERVPLNVSFRRAIIGDNLKAWHEIVANVVDINLRGQKDRFTWDASKNGTFTVNSMYKKLMFGNVIPRQSFIWKLRLPLKIKIFLWYLKEGVILTKDNLAKRRWKGSLRCCFCRSHETIQYLFFDCPMVIFRGTHWARLWSLLLKEEDGNMLKNYCKVLEMRVLEFFSNYGWNFRGRIEAYTVV
uniref:OSJNBa0028I23.15 protein n=1 Tax=Oryza sativa subsp. japonica TaxID=39947 RepID=Q7XMG7_ORYSJ|nr:OSJNBa0028I23.15 [Oryza sativa Japonica Group]